MEEKDVMKKKLMTLVLSAVLCLGFSVTAMAAPSPSTTTASDSVNVTQTAVSAAVLEEIGYDDEASRIAFVQEKAGVQLASMSVYGSTDITPNRTYTADELAAGVAATFLAPGVSADNTVLVLHKKADGAWEVIQATAGNGTITGIFHSFSPVFYCVTGTTHYHNYTAYVTEPGADTWGYTTHICECGDQYIDTYVAPTGAGQAAATAATGAVSPKTAESSAPYAIALLAAAAVAGLAVTSRKRA